MAAKKKTGNKSPLVGTITKPITLDQTTKLDIDTDKKLLDNIIEASIGGNLNTAAIYSYFQLKRSGISINRYYDEGLCCFFNSTYVCWRCLWSGR